MNYEFDVALSFAGEEREYVEKVAEFLQSQGIRVFYDRFEDTTLWGKDLFVHLDEIYRKKARYCVMFLSKDYASKVWTKHERESAQARALDEKSEYILPARFDDTEIPGIRPTIGYIDLRKKSPEEFASLILRKLKEQIDKRTSEEKETFRKPSMTKHSFNPYDEAQSLIDFISNEIKKRCNQLSSQDVSISKLNRGGRTCLRVVCNGETKYSLDLWIGGMLDDSSLNFYGIIGEPTFSSNSVNAWGKVIWSQEKEEMVIELHDLSLLGDLGIEREYTRKEFLDALWNKICDALESKY